MNVNGTAPQSALAEYPPKTRIVGACTDACAADNAGQKRMAAVATNLNSPSTVLLDVATPLVVLAGARARIYKYSREGSPTTAQE